MKKTWVTFALCVFLVLLLSACAPGNEEPSDAELAEERKNAEAEEWASRPIVEGANFLSDKSNPSLGEVNISPADGPVSKTGWGHLHSQISAFYTSGEVVVTLSRKIDGNPVFALYLDFSETGFLTVSTPNGGNLRVPYSKGDIWEGSLGGPGFYVRFLNGEIQFH